MNTGAQFAYDAKITARFYDSSNALLAQETGFSMRTRIDPGARVPFRVLLSNAPATIARYELSVQFSTSTILDYRNIGIVSRQVRDNFGPEVFGDVKNEQSVKVNNIKVLVTFYDAAGTVVYTDSQYQSLDLAAGATGPYTISTLRSGLVYSSYLVQAEGYTN